MRYVLVIALFASCCLGAAPVAADTQLGIQGLVLSGRHLQPGHDVSGSGSGALLE